MNLPDQKKLFKNIEIKIHNGIFRCVVCEEHKDLMKEKVKIVVRCLGIAPLNKGVPNQPQTDQMLAPLMEYAPVCEECFHELGLEEDVPKVIVPDFVPPKNVAEQLKQN